MTDNPVVSSLAKKYACSQNAFLPRFVTVPLSQEYNVTCKCVVAPGELVSEGQVIAQTSGDFSAVSYVHSPVPGRIAEIVPCVSPNGRQEHAVRIQLGGRFSYLGKRPQEESLDRLYADEVIRKLQNNGVVNTFSTLYPENFGIQLKNVRKEKCLVVRMFDEDPHRITDYLVAKFYFDEVVLGAKAVAKAIHADGILFAIDQKFAGTERFGDIVSDKIRYVEMNIKRYPCGTKREIVSAFSRNIKKSCGFDVTKNDLFTDASTMYEAYKAVLCDIPSMSRLVHFSGDCLNASCLLNVKIGTSVREVVAQLGDFVRTPSLIVVNGFFNGTSISSLDVPITKYVKSVHFVSKRKLTDTHVCACVHCGNCRSACPVHISPDILYNNAGNFHSLEFTYARTALACIDCGLCSTVCPSRLPLCQTISVLRENQDNF